MGPIPNGGDVDRHVVHVGMRVGPEVEKTYVPQGQEGFRIGGCRWQQPPTMWSPFGGEGPE